MTRAWSLKMNWICNVMTVKPAYPQSLDSYNMIRSRALEPFRLPFDLNKRR
jgi:hypothetical protein